MQQALKRYLTLLILAGSTATGAAFAAAQRAQQPAATDERAIRDFEVELAVRAFEAEVMDSYNRGDAAQAASHYSINAFVFIPGQPPTRGRDAISANITRFMQDANFKLGYQNEALEISASHDVAYTRGKLQVTYTDKESGAARTTNGNYLLVMRWKPNAGWQVVEDISF